MLKDNNYFVDQVETYLRLVFRIAIGRFQLGELSIHGPTHWLKVLRNATLLAQNTVGADLLICQLFAMLHDCERQDDGADLKHGSRAATYAMELHQMGKLTISQPQLIVLCYACEHHAHGKTSRDSTTGVCWDADRLDLPRVGARVDAKYLSTQSAKTMI